MPSQDKNNKIFLLVPNFRAEKKSIMSVRARQPLSEVIIASILREAGYEIRFLDANVLNYYDEKILQAISDFHPDVLIVTTAIIDRWECPNSHINNIFRLIDHAAAKYKVITGSHGTTMPQWVFESCQVDYVIRGEPELATKKIVDFLAGNFNGGLSEIAGLSYRQDGAIINNLSERISDLDSLPMPAYDLLPMDKYSDGSYGQPFSIIMTSRGCPYECVFCLKAMMPGRYIVRSVDRVIEELEYLINNFQIKYIFFQDWEFFIDGHRVERICEAIIAKNLKFFWGANARATDIIKGEKLMPLVKQAGCIKINLGMESASNRVLTRVNKKITQTDLQQAIDIFKKSGIEGGYCVLLNAPGENRETIRETLGFIFKNNLSVKKFMPVIPYPGTALFELIKRNFPHRELNWNNVEKYAGLTETELSPFLSLLYLRNYKNQLRYGRWYWLKPIFWRQVVFKKIV